MASSSVALKRFEPLFCFLAGWLLRGVGDARLEAPVPELPRCWPKKLTVLRVAGWICAGEAGPEDAEAFDEDATGGGLEDIVLPNQGSTMVRDDDEDAGSGCCRHSGERERRAGVRVKKRVDIATNCWVWSVWVPQKGDLRVESESGGRVDVIGRVTCLQRHTTVSMHRTGRVLQAMSTSVCLASVN
jgi:hypothetical protein